MSLYGELDSEQTQKELVVIDKLTHLQCATIYRFSAAGHPYFNSNCPELVKAFAIKFDAYGGMTPTVSKQIGWD